MSPKRSRSTRGKPSSVTTSLPAGGACRRMRAAFGHGGRLAPGESIAPSDASGGVPPRCLAEGGRPHEALARQGPAGLAAESASFPRTDLRGGRVGCPLRSRSAGLDRKRSRPVERRSRGSGVGQAVRRRRAVAGVGAWPRTSSRSSASAWTNCTTTRPRFPSSGPT